MNTWLLMRRLRGPAFLILVGITALLNQWGVLSFSRSWPLYLILAGVIGLAERAALANAPPAPLYPGAYAPQRYSPGAAAASSSDRHDAICTENRQSGGGPRNRAASRRRSRRAQPTACRPQRACPEPPKTKTLL